MTTTPIAAVFFDFAGHAVQRSRPAATPTSRQLRVRRRRRSGWTRPTQTLRAAYRQGMGVGYRSVATPSGLPAPRALRPLVRGDGRMRSAARSTTPPRRRRSSIASTRATHRGRRAATRAACDTASALRGRVAFTCRSCRTSTTSSSTRCSIASGSIAVIDAVTSSEQAGSCKPDARDLPGRACAKAGMRTLGRVLFVGDSVEPRRAWAASLGHANGAGSSPDAAADPGDVRRLTPSSDSPRRGARADRRHRGRHR